MLFREKVGRVESGVDVSERDLGNGHAVFSSCYLHPAEHPVCGEDSVQHIRFKLFCVGHYPAERYLAVREHVGGFDLSPRCLDDRQEQFGAQEDCAEFVPGDSVVTDPRFGRE